VGVICTSETIGILIRRRKRIEEAGTTKREGDVYGT